MSLFSDAIDCFESDFSGVDLGGGGREGFIFMLIPSSSVFLGGVSVDGPSEPLSLTSSKGSN